MRHLKEVIKELRQNHGNKTQVAKKLGISSQLLGQYEQGRQEPKIEFFEKWKNVFGEDLRAIQKQTNVSKKTDNHTPVDKQSDNAEKPLGADNMDSEIYKEMYEKFIGTNSDYLVIHKDILKQHRIIAVEQFEKDKEEREIKKAEAKTQAEKDKIFLDAQIEANRDMARKLDILIAKLAEVQKG